MSPVRMGAAIVRRIRSYEGTNDDTPITAFWKFNRINHVTSKQVIAAMKDAIQAIGKDVLHIKKEEIGTYLIRLDAAMAMFLGHCGEADNANAHYPASQQPLFDGGGPGGHNDKDNGQGREGEAWGGDRNTSQPPRRQCTSSLWRDGVIRLAQDKLAPRRCHHRRRRNCQR
jgi:hypothetical protein